MIHPMTRIAHTAYRYKRPPRKRHAVALDVPAVVKAAGQRTRPKPAPAAPPTPANDDRTQPPPAASAIVTIRSRKHAMLAHLLEDMTPEGASAARRRCRCAVPRAGAAGDREGPAVMPLARAAVIRILGWMVVVALALGGPGLLVWALWQ
jgi:hypothetical protein